MQHTHTHIIHSKQHEAQGTRIKVKMQLNEIENS